MVRQSLRIAQEEESVTLAQKLEIEALKAQREREIQEAKDTESATVRRTKILQDKSVEEEEIRTKLAVQQSQIEADIALEECNKPLKVAQTLQKQVVEIAEINRQQSVEAGKLQAQVQIAESERLARLAKKMLRSQWQTKDVISLLAEAAKAKAESAVTTATEVEKAEPGKHLSLIAAERKAQERNISDRNVVEIEAFRRKRQAEIAQQAAELEAKPFGC